MVNSRLLSGELDPAANTIVPIGNPYGTISSSTASTSGLTDAEVRQRELRERERERQQKAMQRQRHQQEDLKTSAARMTEKDTEQSPYAGMSDLISSRISENEANASSRDRKPMADWGRKDWGEFITSVAGGFSNAKDGQFSSGLSAGAKGGSDYLGNLDKEAREHRKRMEDRNETLRNMELEDEIRQRRLQEGRNYDQLVRKEERGIRRGEREEDRAYNEAQRQLERSERKGDVREERQYARGVADEERVYRAEAARAANEREDAKELRVAIAKRGKDYSDDFIKVAASINKDLSESGQPPLDGDALVNEVNKVLSRAYGVGSLGAAGVSDTIPANRTLSSGIE